MENKSSEMNFEPPRTPINPRAYQGTRDVISDSVKNSNHTHYSQSGRDKAPQLKKEKTWNLLGEAIPPSGPHSLTSIHAKPGLAAAYARAEAENNVFSQPGFDQWQSQTSILPQSQHLRPSPNHLLQNPPANVSSYPHLKTSAKPFLPSNPSLSQQKVINQVPEKTLWHTTKPTNTPPPNNQSNFKNYSPNTQPALLNTKSGSSATKIGQDRQNQTSSAPRIAQSTQILPPKPKDAKELHYLSPSTGASKPNVVSQSTENAANSSLKRTASQISIDQNAESPSTGKEKGVNRQASIPSSLGSEESKSTTIKMPQTVSLPLRPVLNTDGDYFSNEMEMDLTNDSPFEANNMITQSGKTTSQIITNMISNSQLPIKKEALKNNNDSPKSGNRNAFSTTNMESREHEKKTVDEAKDGNESLKQMEITRDGSSSINVDLKKPEYSLNNNMEKNSKNNTPEKIQIEVSDDEITKSDANSHKFFDVALSNSTSEGSEDSSEEKLAIKKQVLNENPSTNYSIETENLSREFLLTELRSQQETILRLQRRYERLRSEHADHLVAEQQTEKKVRRLESTLENQKTQVEKAARESQEKEMAEADILKSLDGQQQDSAKVLEIINGLKNEISSLEKKLKLKTEDYDYISEQYKSASDAAYSASLEIQDMKKQINKTTTRQPSNTRWSQNGLDSQYLELEAKYTQEKKLWISEKESLLKKIKELNSEKEIAYSSHALS